MSFVVIQGDCLEVMDMMPSNSVDLILADLPYGTTACKWDVLIPFEPLWSAYKRLAKKGAAIVLTASQPFTSALVMSNVGMFSHSWVWEKSNGGGFLNANRQPLKRHEDVLVFWERQGTYNPQKTKGKPYRCTRASAGETTFDQTVAGWVTENKGDRFPTTIIRFPNETGLHPTQKPVPLFEYLIKTYSNPGDLVLDNCCGSGTTGVACMNTGRKFIGIEKEQAYVEIAKKRIEAARAAAVTG